MESNPLATDTFSRMHEAARFIRSARYLTAFTGAGISVESGIPPFRGEGGLWSRYAPRMLELDFFLAHPETAWPVIREIFYDHFGRAQPNRAARGAGSLGGARRGPRRPRRSAEGADHAEYRHLALQCWQQ
jgi:hypothetical protein